MPKNTSNPKAISAPAASFSAQSSLQATGLGLRTINLSTPNPNKQNGWVSCPAGQPPPSKRPAPSVPTKDHVMVCKYSNSGAQVVTGYGDGSVGVFSAAAGRSEARLRDGNGLPQLPVTCISCKPRSKEFLSGGANGFLTRWSLDEAEPLDSAQLCEAGVLACDFNSTGSMYAAGTADSMVYLYDEQTSKPVRSWGGRADAHAENGPGHTNSVQAVCFAPAHPDLLVTASWDHTMKVFDVRAQGPPVHSIYGPYVTGAALDVDSRGRILTGSHRGEDQLQVWDLTAGKALYTIPWRAAKEQTSSPGTSVYTAQFSAGYTDHIIAGGTHPHEVRMFSLGDVAASSWAPPDAAASSPYACSAVLQSDHCVYSLDLSPDGKQLALGGAQARLVLVDLAKAGVL